MRKTNLLSIRLYLLFVIALINIQYIPTYGQKPSGGRIQWNGGCDSTFVFKITDKEALKFLKDGGSEKLMPTLLYNHVATFKDNWWNAPGQGHFIYANIHGNDISYTYAPIVPFQVFLFNEYGILTLQVIDENGEVRSDAKVRIQNGRWRLFDSQVPYDKESKVYRIDDWSERTLRILTVECDKFKAIFDLSKQIVLQTYGSDYSWSDHHGPDFYSYMITDKNKYKPGETVRFKSYALSGSKRPLKDSLELWLQKPDGYYNYKKITNVGAYNPGGFAGELALDDSLKLRLDKSYDMQLRDKKGQIVANTSFKYEDYVLYDTHLETKVKDFTQYYPNDNEIEIKVVDANNLIMPDLRAEIKISRGDVRKSYVDLLVVPDIIKSDTIDMNDNSPTTYKIPASLFDKTDCTYNINVSVLTPDGQALNDSRNIVFYKSHSEVNYEMGDSSVIFRFSELGVDKSVPATISIDGGEQRDITLPYTEKFNQNAETYMVYVPSYGIIKTVNVDYIEPGLDIKGGFVKDSLALELINPLALDVSWFIYEGNQLLEKGSGKEINFKKPFIDPDVCYYLEAFFTLGGKKQVYRHAFVPKKEFLNIDWNMPARIYPGQKIDSRIKITDSYGRNVKGVDITAFAYNTLLNYDVPDLPYYGNTPRGREKRDSYDIKKKYANYTQKLTQDNYAFWNNIAHLDLNNFYRFTFPNPHLDWTSTNGSIPNHGMFMYSIDTPDSTTEVAPFVMSNGNAEMIYAIELDEKPVYFSWTQQPKGYSFLVDDKTPHKISLRLYDRLIIIDSCYFDKGKKTIISLNLNNMPKSSFIRVIGMYPHNEGTLKNPFWVYMFEDSEEKRYIKYISSIPITAGRFIYLTKKTTTDSIVVPVYYPRINEQHRYYDTETYQMIGPLDEGMYRYMDGVEYYHEGGFQYKYAGNVVYKYPFNPFPRALTQDPSNNFNILNDFCLTPKEFKRSIGLAPTKEEKWVPRIVYLRNTTIHVPDDKKKSGLRGIIMRDRDSGKLFVPVFDRAVLGVPDESGLYGLKGMSNGDYDVFALFANGNYLRYDNVPLYASCYVELKMDNCVEHSKDSISAQWLKYQPTGGVQTVSPTYSSTRTQSYTDIGQSYFNPANDVQGVVTDESGVPIIGCSIYIKGGTAGTMTDIDGKFILDLHGLENTLVFNFIGYNSQEIKVTRGSNINVILKENNQALEEVVVIGYGSVRKLDYTGSVSVVAGEDLAAYHKAEDFEETETDASDKLYNELLQLNGMRSNFSDVGFWQPKLITDKRGEANFTVTFPDNITKWNAVVYAMNRKLKTGTLRCDINSYKPLMAEIRAPQFLVEGDSAVFSTNIRNYTKDNKINGNVIFVNNGDSVLRAPVHFEASYQQYLPVVAPTKQDSLYFSYRFTRDDGYSDGERRGVSIERQGTEIANGTLQFLRNGDNMDVKAAPDEQVEISITGKPIDIYMDVANDLIQYKYDCNEQLASKLIGLLDYRIYTQYEEKPFKYDKNVNEIISRLLKNQNQHKLWSWWSNDNNTSFWMSAHVLRALNMARKDGYAVNLDIHKVQYDYMDVHNFRNTNLYDIDVLNALVDWGTQQNYKDIIELFEKKIASIEAHEDSLVAKYQRTKNPKDYAMRHSYLTQKLTLMEMRQKLGLPYDRKLITDNMNKDVLGTINIKDPNKSLLYWYYDNQAANVIAYRIARNDSTLRQYMDAMQMYILGTKRYGWNTYQASSALMTILPDLLSKETTASNPATITLRGKENKSVKTFPYHTTLRGGEQLSIRKVSGMPLIYSAYTMERRTEQHSGEAFDITTSIDGATLRKGVPAMLTVSVNVKQDNAENVMIEVPVPAGCDYQSKGLSFLSNEVYREYFKEKTVIFCEKLPKGTYSYTINLMPRYSGRYILNPAKVEMMYFPVVNANNNIDKVNIE